LLFYDIQRRVELRREITEKGSIPKKHIKIKDLQKSHQSRRQAQMTG